MLAAVSAFAMLPLVLIIALSSSTTAAVQAVAWSGAAIMAALLGIALANQKGLTWALLSQVGYYAAFFAVMLSATYIVF
jgi:hypothetical protein